MKKLLIALSLLLILPIQSSAKHKNASSCYSGTDSIATRNFVARYDDYAVNPDSTRRAWLALGESDYSRTVKKICYMTNTCFRDEADDSAIFSDSATAWGYDPDSGFYWNTSGSDIILRSVNAVNSDGSECFLAGGDTVQDTIADGDMITFCGWSDNRWAADFRRESVQKWALWKVFSKIAQDDTAFVGVMIDEALMYNSIWPSGHISMFNFPLHESRWIQGEPADVNGFDGMTWDEIRDSLAYLAVSGDAWYKKILDSLNTVGWELYANTANYLEQGTDAWDYVTTHGGGTWCGEGMGLTPTFSSYHTNSEVAVAESLMANIIAADTGYAIIWTGILTADTVTLGSLSRCQMERLAWYLCNADTQRLQFMCQYNISENYDNEDTLYNYWTARYMNYGAPDSSKFLAKTGTDGAGNPYNIYGRTWTFSDPTHYGANINYYVLSRVQRGEVYYGANTAVSVTLPTGTPQGTNRVVRWVEVNADGSFGNPVTETTIRNAEGKIFKQIEILSQERPLNIQWEKSYGADSTYEEFRSISTTSDGGYICAGTCFNPSGSRDEDVYVVKTDSNGIMEWEGRYGGDGIDKGYSVRETSNGNFIICGHSNSTGVGSYGVYLLKLDADGDSLWAQVYGAAQDDRGRCAIEASNGQYVLVGKTKAYGDNSDFDIFISRVDSSDGTVDWSSYKNTGDDDALQYIIEKDNGNFIVSGFTQSSDLGDDSTMSGRPDAFMAEIDSSDGDTVWTAHSGGDYWYEHYSASFDNTGNLILFGGGNYAPTWKEYVYNQITMNPTILVADSSDGSTIYYQEHSFPRNNVYTFAGKQLASGDILAVGSYGVKDYSERSKSDGYIALMDSKGNLLDWDRMGSSAGDEFHDLAVDGNRAALAGIYDNRTGNYYANKTANDSADAWLVVYNANRPTTTGGKRGLLVLGDTLEVSSDQYNTADSASIIYDMINWGGYVYDSISLGDYADELFDDTASVSYADKYNNFRNYIDNYSVVLVPQRKIEDVGDTSAAAPPRGLQQYMVSALVDYVYDGGCLISFDNFSPTYNDSLGYKNLFGWSGSGVQTTDSISVYADNYYYSPYLGATKDTRNIDGLTRDGKEFANIPVITALGSWVDTLAVSGEGTNRPLIIAAERGLGGLAIQWLCIGDIYHHVYDSDSLMRVGAGTDFDYLLYGQLDYALAKNCVSATFEMQGLYAGLIDDILGHDSTGEDSYRNILGGFLSIGLPVRNSYYLDRIDATDSAALQDLHTSGYLSNSYQSKDDAEYLFIDSDSSNYTSDEWDSILNIIATHEDTAGYSHGLVIDPNLKATKWLFDTGTDSSVTDWLFANGINFTDNRYGDYDDLHATYRLGRPYESRYCGADWRTFKAESNSYQTYYIDNLWHYGYYKPNGTWEPSSHFDPWYASQYYVVNDDTVSAIKSKVGEYIEGAYRAKFGGVIYGHGSVMELAGLGTFLEPIMPFIADTLNALNAVTVTCAYLEKLSCYRDSVYILNYTQNKNRVSFDVRHIYHNGQMPINLYYTVRKVLPDNSIATERVFLPKNWQNEISCWSEYNTKTGEWSHFPGFKAESGYIKATDEGTDGWFN